MQSATEIYDYRQSIIKRVKYYTAMIGNDKLKHIPVIVRHNQEGALKARAELTAVNRVLGIVTLKASHYDITRKRNVETVIEESDDINTEHQGDKYVRQSHEA